MDSKSSRNEFASVDIFRVLQCFDRLLPILSTLCGWFPFLVRWAQFQFKQGRLRNGKGGGGRIYARKEKP